MPKVLTVIYCATFKGLNAQAVQRQEALKMEKILTAKKFFSENVEILVLGIGVLSEILMIGLFYFYGLDKIF